MPILLAQVRQHGVVVAFESARDGCRVCLGVERVLAAIPGIHKEAAPSAPQATHFESAALGHLGRHHNDSDDCPDARHQAHRARHRQLARLHPIALHLGQGNLEGLAANLRVQRLVLYPGEVTVVEHLDRAVRCRNSDDSFGRRVGSADARLPLPL